MPKTDVWFYCNKDGNSPMLEWLQELAKNDTRTYNKCLALIYQLEERGHELRRPTADILRDGIYELRAKVGKVNYRLLYFFYGKDIAILEHAFTKTAKIPKEEIKRALNRKAMFEANPELHTYKDE
jgi:phage-related protein